MTAEDIEKELRMLEIQYWEGDSMPRPEYERMKAELERRLEEYQQNVEAYEDTLRDKYFETLR